MPRLGVDPDYRFGEELSLSSGLRSRSRSPHSYVGYTSKEEQEWQDHQLALRLQEEADRERLALVEDTLAPEQIEAILGSSFHIPSTRSEPDSNDDVVILSETSSPSSLTRSNSPAEPVLSRAEQHMYDGELTLLSEGEGTQEDDSDGDDSSDEGADESESEDNQLEEQSDDSEEEMDASEDDDDLEENAENEDSESSESESTESDEDEDRLSPLGVFNNLLRGNLDTLDSDDDEDRLSPGRLFNFLRESLGPIVGELSLTDLEQVFEERQREIDRDSLQDSDEEDEPDDTVIRSGDYGRCTICFEEVPYDPVGCIYCQQLIGCRRCVNRWYKAAHRADVDFLGGHPPSNHKQCPLCRHEWADQVEVTSIFLLKDD